MNAKQAELYKNTKKRMRRLGLENPADVIIALAEEIDHYRDKIRSMEEFIANRERKRGNETGLVAELRNKKSRDNRELLDRAADRIEELEASLREQRAGEWTLVGYGNGRAIHWKCSVCGFETLDVSNGDTNFCPNCGADMRGE